VIVLRPGTLDLWAAPPFSAGPTGFRVRSGNRSLFGTCAWDAFGVPAALHADADVEASCPSSGEPIRCGVRGGRAFGDAVIHLLVPAAQFWDDVIYT
jgi:Alkylmercury lyase